MRVVNMTATLGSRGIEAEDSLDGFGAVARRVDQTHVERHMLTVVGVSDWLTGGSSRNEGVGCPMERL
jgi:hypothetical protein